MNPRRLSAFALVILVAIAIASIWILARHFHSQSRHSVADLSRTSPLNQPGGSGVPAEAYEPYSALYQQQPADEPLVFAADSYADIPQLNGSCLHPATVQEHEMADAFAAANKQSHPWQRNFEIPQGYQLLTPAEVQQVERCLDTHFQNAADCAQYKNIRHVRRLGIPGFDQTHTHALVSVIKEFATNRGSGGIFEVEKSAGTWHRAETTIFTRDCSWMY
jgi:hypothetical protein